jgi:hypothetical protein
MTWRVPKEKYGDRWFNVQRFDTLCEKDPVSDCWLWTGPVNNIGYGMFGFSRETPDHNGRMGNMMTAHRASWMMAHNKPIPAGMNVNHTCHIKNCVNPDHLEIGTQQEKIESMLRDGWPFGSPGHGHNRGRILGPRLKKDFNRKYKYSEDEIQWIRTADSRDIMTRYNLKSMCAAASFRHRMREGYKWLPLPEDK